MGSKGRPRAEVDREIIAGAGPYFGGLDTSRLEPNKGGGIGLEFLSDKGDGIKDVDYAFKVHAAIERTLNRIWREHRGIDAAGKGKR